MRVLLIHSDYLRFEAKKKALKDAEELKETTGGSDDALVVFMAFEKPDEQDVESVKRQLIDGIKDTYGKVKAQSIVLYPYAHLSSNLGNPKLASKLIDDLYDELRGDYKVVKAPFGWYKSFELKCKGHPLSELSRTILPEGQKPKADEKAVSEALKGEEKLKSTWHILTEDGTLHEISEFDYASHENLKKFSFYEKEKDRTVDRPPPHIELMRKLELADYEPGSDPGNFRYYPKGRMVKALIEQYVTENILDYGGIEVETPIMYDLEHPTLAKYLNRFPARQYLVESEDKKFFLRFAACFGQFLMAHDATISYKNLPLRLYELARYAFRREKSGELTGLRRLRAFTMPDVHALCEDMTQAMDEYRKRFALCIRTLDGLGISKDDVEIGIRVTREFYESNKDFVLYLVKEFGKPALVEMWDARIFYFVLKYELNFVDALDKSSALSTDQIDVENGERYDIRFTGRDGQKRNPIILHCSPSGAVERIIYALLEKAYMAKEAGGVPTLPMWLCPTQVRVIPVSEEYLAFANEVADRISKERIRVDVDDRSEPLGGKIRDAEREWIPRIVVVGAKERESKRLQVRTRETKKQEETTIEELTAGILGQTQKKPFRPLPLPRNLSGRPKFSGVA
ncbi:MAG: threonine--tRNA ligase [Candidatus Altiarchaeota archaeon]|nr:threonine--tRNA ligase [Candidatus Altiarchaeota archaeon]